MARPSIDLTRTLLAALFLLALMATSLWILQSFIGAAIWAVMVVVASWPVMLWIELRLGQRRALAVAAMTLLLLLLFVVPMVLAIVTVITHADQIVELAKSLASMRLPKVPVWLADLPVIGTKLEEVWQQAAINGLDTLLAQLEPYAGEVTKWFVGKVGGLGFLAAQLLLTLLLAALMYANGEAAAQAVRRFGFRLAGEHGDNAVLLAGQAIRGVALGVGGTAVVQSVLAGLGLAVAGVPFSGLLTAVMFMLCLAQLGPLLVLVPAVFWVYSNGSVGWGTFLLVCAVLVSTLDNVLRPFLIRRGADLPLLLIFAGVIGGLLGFGLIGIFVGPVVLAVAYKLLQSWLDADGDSDSVAG
jgi:predicted PurR-regulated permease PerM